MAALRMPRVRVQGPKVRAGGTGMGLEGQGRRGKPQGRSFRANALGEGAGCVVQVVGGGIDRERLVLG